MKMIRNGILSEFKASAIRRGSVHLRNRKKKESIWCMSSDKSCDESPEEDIIILYRNLKSILRVLNFILSAIESYKHVKMENDMV